MPTLRIGSAALVGCGVGRFHDQSGRLAGPRGAECCAVPGTGSVPGTCRRTGDYPPYTSNSATCPAGQPVLPVNVNRTNRWLEAPRAIVTALPDAGSNV
jgi:hypothetical protein